ncbi:hypothetical protein KCP78_00985 [Salmonella enterica subsp. enterica]|nr:hypothetical protein KCP78_00985 [Salmonella enterica subsp. enterica]
MSKRVCRSHWRLTPHRVPKSKTPATQADNVQYGAARRFKVYLIDEVHMLSRHSFNALL